MATAIVLVLFIMLVNLLRQPVAVGTRSYVAEFIDASGLHLDADVRVRGVRVGKVKSLTLERKAGQSIAAVEFSLDKRYAVVSATRLSIKYQALTGLRYVDVVNPSEAASAASVLSRIPASMTQPSFDITTLFNGLQPVIATLSPEDIDIFTQNAATYLSGEGGLGPMLDSIRKLTQFVSNRQQVVATLMRNLNAVADVFGGHSKDFIKVLDWLNRPIDAAISVLDEFRKTELYGPAFVGGVVRLLVNLGFPREGTGDLNEGFDRAITVFDDYTRDVLKLIPVMWDNIGPPSSPEAPLPCSRGRAQLPESMDVLLNGQRVVLCNQ